MPGSLIAVLASMAFCARLLAGGSGLNVVVVVNQNSSNSVELGNYYCERRTVSPQNLLRINWAGGPVGWTRAEFEANLRAPLNAMLAARQLTNQIDYVLLSMDIPYRVTETNGTPLMTGVNSTTAALFYGFKPNGPDPYGSCNLPVASSNRYAGSEDSFRQSHPISATSNSWLVMMLTASNLAQAKAVVDRGVNGDYTAPTQTIYFAKADDDRLRKVRAYTYDNALINLRVRGGSSVERTNAVGPAGLGQMLGFQNGRQTLAMATNLFAPGALADVLTSFSGWIFENSGHTDALDFLNSGATASHGTVVEPCAYLEKFPSPQLYFYQACGFDAAESYYLSLTNPYQGLVVGEPLSAPFAVPATGGWIAPPANSILSGVTNLSVSFQAVPDRPLQGVDLFLDGQFLHTVTNLSPQAGNLIYITINGVPTNFTVSAGATIKSIAANIAPRLNATAYTNATKVRATAHGHRIELQSLDLNRPGSATTLSVSNAAGSASVSATHLAAARNDFLDKAAFGLRSYEITNTAGSSVPLNAFLQLLVLKTNGTAHTISVTNTVPGTPLNVFAKTLFDLVNTNGGVQQPDGLVVEDVNLHEDWPYNEFVYGSNDFSGEFNLRARSPGWPESQLRVRLSGSPSFLIKPSGTNRLDENVGDLRPRNHIYVTAGLTNLDLSIPFNTSTNADGYHEFTAVAYEGSHVRTQTRVSRDFRIQNNSWSATFTTLLGGSNTALEATMQFSVAATTNNITKIELFTTGGLFAVSNNVASASFSVAATNLGVGLHPFYALVTRSDGKQYRTETRWYRIIREEMPFPVSVGGSPPLLTWPATAGRHYQVLSAVEATNTFTPRAAVTPTNSTGQWLETDNASPRRLYRVKTP